MRRNVTVLAGLSVAAIVLASGCTSIIDRSNAVTGSGNVATETRPATSFSAVTISGPFDTKIKVGSPASVRVTSDDNVLQFIVTEVTGDTLDVHFRNNTSLRNTTGYKLEVSVPALTSASADAAGRLTISGLSGSQFALKLDASSQATVSGSVETLRVDGSAASIANLADLHATTAQVSLDAASVAELTVAESVSGEANAASVLKLHGSPQVEVSTHAASTVVNE